MEEFFTAQSLMALATLSILEIVLGIDNVVFLAILSGKLPPEQQGKARTLGLLLAAGGRIALLFAISWVITLDSYVVFDLPFTMPGAHEAAVIEGPESIEAAGHESGTTPISVKDIILILGGFFLLAKSTWEIGHQMEGHEGEREKKAPSSFGMVLLQILAIDLVFSIDSVLTAVGMVNPSEYDNYWAAMAIMVTAVVLSIAVMIAFAGPVARFVNTHPSVKMLALSFLILIGVVLVAEGFHSHIPRGYIYMSMAFSLFVEVLNLRASRRKLENHTATH
jgi:predicted tellurium resistance membrane protein TerC